RAVAYVLAIGLLSLPFLLLSPRISGRTRAVLGAQMAAIGLFLLIYPAKWPYYVAAYVPWISIAWAHAGDELTRRSQRLPAVSAAVVLVLAYYSAMTATERYGPSIDPQDASLFRISILEPLFGVPANDQEKLIDGIPRLIGDHRVLAEPYIYPMI